MSYEHMSAEQRQALAWKLRRVSEALSARQNDPDAIASAAGYLAEGWDRNDRSAAARALAAGRRLDEGRREAATAEAVIRRAQAELLSCRGPVLDELDAKIAELEKPL